MPDIFICYARKDHEVADRLCELLRSEGWLVWMDTRLSTGAKWRKEIQKQLAEARCAIVLWSAAAEQSDYVMDEADEARRRGILVPALIEPMPLPPYGFRQVQTTSLVGWIGQDHHAGIEALLDALRTRLSEPSVPEAGGAATRTTWRWSEGKLDPMQVAERAGAAAKAPFEAARKSLQRAQAEEQKRKQFEQEHPRSPIDQLLTPDREEKLEGLLGKKSAKKLD